MEKVVPISFDNTETAFACKSDKELKKANFLFTSMAIHWLVKAGTRIAPLALKWRLPVKGIIRNTMYEQFCGGETLEKTAATSEKLGKSGVGVILDYGVEAKEGEAEFEKTAQEFIRVINYAAAQQNIAHIAIKVTGFARFGLLEKLHAGGALNEAEQQEYERVRLRVLRVCRTAAEKNTGILFDAEESWIQQPVDGLCMEMMKKFNREDAIIFNTFQLYRHDRLEFLQRSFDITHQEGVILGAKLVRGAYMEKERRRAAGLNYRSPIQPDKEATDRDYNAALTFCIDHIDHICFFVASHNECSNLLATELLMEKGIPLSHPHVHFSQLYGMSDHISFNLAKAGCRVSKYMPYGPVEDVIPYLMRRAQENSSVSGQTSRELALIRKEIKRRRGRVPSLPAEKPAEE